MTTCDVFGIENAMRILQHKRFVYSAMLTQSLARLPFPSSLGHQRSKCAALAHTQR